MTDKFFEDMFSFFQRYGIEDKAQEFRHTYDTTYDKIKENFYRLRISERYNNFNINGFDVTDTSDQYESLDDWVSEIDPLVLGLSPIFIVALLMIILLICVSVCGQSKENNNRDSGQNV